MGRTIRFGQRYPVATRFTAPVKRRAEITSDDIHAYADWSRQHWFEGGANRIDRKRPGPERGIMVQGKEERQ